MRLDADLIWDLWTAGGPAVGSAAATHGRVTLDASWLLHKVGDNRYFQHEDNDQVETEIPNIEVIDIDRSIDQDAATCQITLSNQWHYANGAISFEDGTLGIPGFLSFSHGASQEAQDRWHQEANDWADQIVPDALLRTYQGYGGKTKDITAAVLDGNILLTGVWLIDEVRIGTSGKVEITCRDMMKLLIEQQLYPPLVPFSTTPASSRYPVKYSRWGFHDLSYSGTDLFASIPAQFGGVQTTALVSCGGTGYAGLVPQPNYPDYQGNEPGNGYWTLINNGTVKAYGNNTNYGSISTNFSSNPALAMEVTVTGKGYWILQKNGTITAKGDAVNYGSSAHPNSLAMARNWLGDGYWVLDWYGNVWSYGSAGVHGGVPTGVVEGGTLAQFWAGVIAVGIASNPIADGFWVIDNEGHVYARGNATYYGQPAGAIWSVSGTAIRVFIKIRAHPDGGGYWCIDQIGNVFAYGTAQHYGQPSGVSYNAITATNTDATFPDYIADLIPTPSGNGYWMLGVSGGVYSFGDAVGLGNPGSPYGAFLRIDGNYDDYSDIVSELVKWAGFTLGGTTEVYGNIETTGAFASDILPDDMFDKQPVIAPITKIKEVVGYLVWVDDEGAFHFESANIFDQGNFDEFGAHTDFIPEIDEAIQLTDYTVARNDKSARSEIIISTIDPTADPTGEITDTVTTRYQPSNTGLRGMIKPALWVNGLFTSKREQEIMAELIALHIWLAQRQGSVTMMANPCIQVNDQVRIWESTTSETYIHYVRGINSHMDLVTGEYMMTLTTHWMGDDSLWAVDLGKVPYSLGDTLGFEEIPLTYALSTSEVDPNGANSPTTKLTDNNLATFWNVPGSNGQIRTNALEFIEYTVDAEINTVAVYPLNYTSANQQVYVSVMEGGVWQGASSITYQPVKVPGLYSSGTYKASIPYVQMQYTSGFAQEIILPRTYDAQRVRVTLSNFGPSAWGPQYYRGGLFEFAVGLR